MTKAIIQIDLGNAAFEDFPGVEVGRILRDLADKLENIPLDEDRVIPLHDINGNLVGSLRVEDQS